MYPDVVDLRRFYTQPLGRVARRLIGHQIRGVWPNVSGMTLAGFGYATPYLQPFLGEATRVVALMPAQQGVVRWPSDEAGLTSLADETHFPLPDESVDRLILVHSVENSDALQGLLRQVWRVLAPGGRVIIVVPNRAGFWARRDKTPFGHGRPYTRTQLTAMLKGAMLSPTLWRTSLYVPPIEIRPFIRSAVAWERLGHLAGQRFAGVLLVEAAKQVYAMPPPLAVEKEVRRRLAPVSVRGVVATQNVTECVQSDTMQKTTPNISSKRPLVP